MTQEKIETVKMLRDPSIYSEEPHTADVNVAEVDNYRTAGFVLESEASFTVPQAAPAPAQPGQPGAAPQAGALAPQGGQNGQGGAPGAPGAPPAPGGQGGW